MSKRGIAWLVAALICAFGAAFIAWKYVLKQKAEGQMALTRVLLANERIKFGTRLKLLSEGEGNVRLVPWPTEYLPAEAITSAEEVKGKNLVAGVNFVRFQPVLKSMVETEDTFVAPNTFFQGVPRDPSRPGLVKPGDLVDILKIGDQRHVQPFIRCARVHSVGEPPAMMKEEGASVKEAKKLIYVLLPMDLFDSMLEAERQDLIVRPSVEECGEGGAELVEPVAVTRAREAREVFQNGQRLVDRNQLEAALEVFYKLVADYRDTPAAERAREAIDKCEQELAHGMLQRAREALEKRDYQRCVELCEGLTQQYPGVTEIVKQAEALGEQAGQEGADRQRETHYRQLAENLDQALKGGNLPRVRELLRELEDNYSDYQAPAPLMSGGELYRRSQEELEELDRAFTMAKKIFEHFLGEGDREKTLEKFETLNEDFPDHPYLQEAGGELRELGWLQ